MKQCQQVSKCNGSRASFDKTGKKLYILEENGLEWYGKGTATNKHYKIGKRNTHYCVKSRCLLSPRTYLYVKEVKILRESDALENIKKGL